MTIYICVGSSCHLKGSPQVVDRLVELLKEHQLEEAFPLAGVFCMGNCQGGVCVRCQERVYSVTQDNVETFFQDVILSQH